MTRTVELQSQEELDAWLADMGDSIRVINVATTPKRWSLTAGFFTNAKTFTVVYEQKPEDE